MFSDHYRGKDGVWTWDYNGSLLSLDIDEQVILILFRDVSANS